MKDIVGRLEVLEGPSGRRSWPDEADLRAAFEAQAKMFAKLDRERSARMRLEAETSQLAAETSKLAAEKSQLAVEKSALEAENAFLKEANFRLEHLVHELRRARFGPRSEKLDPDKQQLLFEDIEIAIAEARESVERRHGPSQCQTPAAALPRLPKDLSHVEQVIEPASIACPCGCGDMVRIGEDRSERLDMIPAQFRVIVTIRPRYACPKGRAGMS